MKYRFRNNLFERSYSGGFSLVEAAAALVILGLICSGVLVVINRAMAATVDSAQRMRAFEVARENMEKVLVSDSVSEKVEYGYSEKYPDIQWTTKIETFHEPVDNKMWVQAICSAAYTDSKGEPAEVELTHWLTKLSDKQVEKIVADRGQMQKFLDLGRLMGDILGFPPEKDTNDL